MKSMTRVFSVLFLLFATLSFAQQKNEKDYSMYPQKIDGYQQKMIFLKKMSNEDNYRVEIFVGKNAQVDVCNNFFLMGDFQEKDVEGWGYNYYQFSSKGDIGGTLMGCSDNKKVEKTIFAQTLHVRYNSKLPIVVYIPEGYVLKYRIWKADKKLITVN